MKTSKMRLSLTLIMALLVGASTSEAVFAAGHGGGGHGGGGHGGGGHGGGGHGGGGHGGGGWHGGAGGWRGGGGWNGGGVWRGGGWNRGGRVGIYLGAPIGFNFGYYPYSYYGAPYYGSPYYYSPAPAYYPPVQTAPVIYTERRDDPQIRIQGAPRNSSQNVHASWWYYCVDSNAYYPYVNKCPGGWLRVAPQPASDSDDQPAVNNVPAP